MKHVGWGKEKFQFGECSCYGQETSRIMAVALLFKCVGSAITLFFQ